MTIKHFIKLIIPTTGKFIESQKRYIRQFKRFKSIRIIRGRIVELEKLALKKGRLNTDGTKIEEFAIKKQIQALKWVIGDNDV